MSTQKEVIDDWYKRVSVTQRAHYLSAEHLAARKFMLGIPTIVLTTLVGTSVFATIQKQTSAWIQIAVGLASVTAAVLAGLQTFLGFAERAEKHRLAGAKYGALGRELEQLRASPDEPTEDAFTQIRKRLDALAIESPNNPPKQYAAAGSHSLRTVS